MLPLWTYQSMDVKAHHAPKEATFECGPSMYGILCFETILKAHMTPIRVLFGSRTRY
jgi:hypothetical protein